MKVVIKEFYELKLKPGAIIEALYDHGIVAPSISQWNSYLRTLKTRGFSATGIKLGEVEPWCMELSSSIPASDDVGFVVSYGIIDDGDYDDNDNDGNKFRFFVSTKRLLRIASTSKRIYANTTYKLMWQRFPVLITGTTDSDRQFHSSGIAICSGEKSKDFTFVFRILQDGVKKLDLQEINPDVLIASDSDAIRNGFQANFSEKPKVMCWAHI